MRKSFVCSLICPNGIIGGGLSINDNAIIYNTNKLTVSEKYRNLVMPLDEIGELSWKRIIFSIAILRMKDGEEYKFIVFNKGRFNKYYNEVKQA